MASPRRCSAWRSRQAGLGPGRWRSRRPAADRYRDDPAAEVALVVAAVGLEAGVLGDDVYAALLLAVLLTAVIARPLLRWRLGQRPDVGMDTIRTADARPEGGWLVETAGRLDLVANPPDQQAALVAFEAAQQMGRLRPGDALLAWAASLPHELPADDRDSRVALFRLLDIGGPRSWRFLHITGLLERLLPELDRR
jgi:hypothetical protein